MIYHTWSRLGKIASMYVHTHNEIVQQCNTRIQPTLPPNTKRYSTTMLHNMYITEVQVFPNQYKYWTITDVLRYYVRTRTIPLQCYTVQVTLHSFMITIIFQSWLQVHCILIIVQLYNFLYISSWVKVSEAYPTRKTEPRLLIHPSLPHNHLPNFSLSPLLKNNCTGK